MNNKGVSIIKGITNFFFFLYFFGKINTNFNDKTTKINDIVSATYSFLRLFNHHIFRDETNGHSSVVSFGEVRNHRVIEISFIIFFILPAVHQGHLVIRLNGIKHEGRSTPWYLSD